MQNRIYLSPPHMSGNEQKYINEAFKTNWIAPLGPNVDQFESKIVEFLGDGYAVAMTSGTAAIHIALIMLGVSRGDYVLCSSMTFVASANPIVYLGAEPIFIDSEQESWNMCPKALVSAIENAPSLPKAVVVVDLLGQSANYGEILAVCRKYNIPVVEDAAESLGARYKNKKCGLFGDFGIFSFNGNKILSSSGGGMLICKTKEHAERAKHLITQAREDAPYYLHTEVGYNYRMSNIIAGIGIAQIEVLEERVAKRRYVNSYYQQSLSEIDYIEFMPEPSWSLSNRWLSSIILSDGAPVEPMEIISALQTENIEARRLWKPLHTQPLFKENRYFSSNGSYCEKLFNQGLSLPSGTQLTDQELDRVINIVKRVCLSE